MYVRKPQLLTRTPALHAKTPVPHMPRRVIAVIAASNVGMLSHVGMLSRPLP